MFLIYDLSFLLQGFEGGPPILLKEEPEDGGLRSIQKVPSLSDLSDPEASLGKCSIHFFFNRIKSLRNCDRKVNVNFI